MTNREIDWVGMSNFIDDFVEDVELYFETPDGVEGFALLDENQKAVVWMALQEFVNHDMFLKVMGYGDKNE